MEQAMAVEVKTTFLNFLDEYENLDDSELPERTQNKILWVLEKCGLETASSVVPGDLRGDFLEQDGSRSGETYSVNPTMRCKVLTEDGKDHYGATDWIDKTVSYARRTREYEDFEEKMTIYFAKSDPLWPIQLTAEGECLAEYPSSNGSHSRDNDVIGSCVIHKYCSCFMNVQEASPQYKALSCRGCNFRVVYPRSVETFGELRAHFKRVLGL